MPKLIQKDFDRHHKQMLDIASNAIEWVTPKEEIKKSFTKVSVKTTAILVAEHPKLEMEVVKKQSGKHVYKLEEKALGKDFQVLDTYNNLIVLSFQTCNYPEQARLIKKLRAAKKWNIVHCSTDLQDEGNDVALYGANKVHLEALLREIVGKSVSRT